MAAKEKIKPCLTDIILVKSFFDGVGKQKIMSQDNFKATGILTTELLSITLDVLFFSKKDVSSVLLLSILGLGEV